jgi:radical SAM superfamily enzyme YgiQ (UPF0313 family)
LAYLAGEARRAGHEVELLDLNLSGYNPARVRLALNRFRPEVVGLSTYTETYMGALVVARQVKQWDASTVVVMGGVHPSILPRETAAEPDVDVVVVGEGERTLVELLGAVRAAGSLAGIRGVVWKDADGAIVANDPRPLLAPDEVGLPARDLLALEFYENAFNVLTARGGCPYRCPFCSASHVWSARHRPRPPKSVVDEIDMMMRDFGARHLFFVDDIFTLRRNWVGELLAEMEQLGSAVSWGCSTRVDCVDEELLCSMASHGCTGIQFGVESGAQEVLDSMKGIDKQSALDAVRWSLGAGISTTCSFMVPFPQDTEATLRETFAFMEQLKDLGAEILMSYTTPYPGTALYDDADELGIKILARDWGEYDAKHLIIETAELPAEVIDRIVAEEVARLGMSRSA